MGRWLGWLTAAALAAASCAHSPAPYEAMVITPAPSLCKADSGRIVYRSSP